MEILLALSRRGQDTPPRLTIDGGPPNLLHAFGLKEREKCVDHRLTTQTSAQDGKGPNKTPTIGVELRGSDVQGSEHGTFELRQQQPQPQPNKESVSHKT